MNHDQSLDSQLPASLPSPSALLHRTQATLGLLREVVQESSAEYWYEKGKIASNANEWENATYAFNRCLQNDNQHWRSALQLAVSLAHQGHVIETAAALVRAYRLPYKTWWKFLYEINVPDKFKANWYLLSRVLSFGKSHTSGFSSWRVLSKIQEENYCQNDIFNIMFGLAIIFRNTDTRYAEEAIKIVEYRLLNSDDKSLLWQRLSGSLPIDRAIYYIYREYEKIVFNPLDAKALYAFANKRLKLDDLINKFEYYDFSHEINPAEFYYRPEHKIYKDLCNYNSIVSAFNEAINLEPDNPLFYESRANAKEKLGDIVGAENDRQIAKTLHNQ